MKSFLNCLVLCGLVFLVACSGDSPRAPVVPTVVPDVWNISSVTPSDPNPYVNVAISVTAVVTKNGEAAPDGTIVEFIATGGVFASSDGVEASVATSDGQAVAVFGASDAGGYVIQARVRAVTRQTTVVYREHTTSDTLQIWSVNPSVGSYNGGETVVLTGKGIQLPVEVYFTAQGTEYQAIVDNAVPSIPLSSAGTITIRTPEPTAADREIDSPTNVRVRGGVGTSSQQEITLPSAFTYLSDSVILGEPVIFGIEPYFGRSRGGELVTILGSNFATVMSAKKELVRTFDQVYFKFRSQLLLARVERWSENQIEVITPRFSLTELAQDELAGVVLTRIGGGDNVEADNIFTVLKDVAQPNITGISPTAGPLDGGTVVTITGSGFQVPVQVLFGTLEATDIQVHDDQTITDNDEITCRTPDYSQQGAVPPFTAAVKVTNLNNGLSHTAAQNFTFGDLLYVGQANPTEGQIGDPLVLYGSGFEDPLKVFFGGAGNIEFDVLGVTGTELSLRSPTDLAPTCTDRTGNFRVVLTQSNNSADGGSYTLLGSAPTITDVDPIFVNEINGGAGVDPVEIDIYGVRFADELLVLVEDYTIVPNRVEVITPEHIHVTGIPSPNDLNLTYDTTDCTAPSGFPGTKLVPTPVDITVKNLPMVCSDTLFATLVYVPEDQTCVVAPSLDVVVPSFPSTPAGNCSLGQPLLLQNTGAAALDISNLNLQGRFFFNPGATIQNEGPLSIPAFGSNSVVSIYFCPDIDNNSVYTGALVIFSNDPNSPEVFNLSGQEAFPAAIETTPVGNGDTWNTFADTTNPACSPPQTLTISNTGGTALTLASVVSSDDVQFHIINPPPAGTMLNPNQSWGVDVEFCPDASGPSPPPRTATLSITHDAPNAGSPIVINMSANAL